MPLTAELSPAFAARYPEIANIFDNLHMLHDNISDILTSELLPTWEGKRAEIYRLVNTYYLAERGCDESDDRTSRCRSIIIEQAGHANRPSASALRCWACRRCRVSLWTMTISIRTVRSEWKTPMPFPKAKSGMEGGVRFNDRQEGRTRVTFQPQIIYGAFDNTQIEIQGDLFTDPQYPRRREQVR